MSKIYIKIGTAVAENEMSPLSSRTWSGNDKCKTSAQCVRGNEGARINVCESGR